MRREYVSAEFNCGPISVIVHRSASDKLAVDSLVLLVCGLSLIPPKREKECSANCFLSKICELVSGKLSKLLYIKQLLDEVFVISEILKVEVSVISRAKGRGS